jgi:hypothetical protein
MPLQVRRENTTMAVLAIAHGQSLYVESGVGLLMEF